MIRVREMDIDVYRHYFNAFQRQTKPAWQYDEAKPCGVNFNAMSRAWLYDRCQQDLRDTARESRDILTQLELDGDATVLDMGCGTGAFAIHAARHVRKVTAVDVSKAMLRQARKKARRARLDNIEFCRDGFLTYAHRGEPVDAAVSVLALHHLPDFWKLVALQRLARAVKIGGRAYIRDVVFSFDPAHHAARIKAFIRATVARGQPATQEDLETHFRQEYSTINWIMEGLLVAAGFGIDQVSAQGEFLAAYVCTRKDEQPCGEQQSSQQARPKASSSYWPQPWPIA